jgi:hypothetical protein
LAESRKSPLAINWTSRASSRGGETWATVFMIKISSWAF